ncbi:hypothetical protein U9M48_040406, partial [Paspalum notatum var. saurae]
MDINAIGSASARQGHHNQEGDPIEHHFDPQGYQLIYPNDEWEFMVHGHVHNSTTNEMTLIQNPVGVGQSQEPNGHADAEIQITTEDNPVKPKSKKQEKGKKVARRGSGFSKEEDKVICSAFLNISKDPIIGVNQSSGGYYKRIHEYYKEHKPEGSNRSQIAMQHRWIAIQKGVNKFCGIKSTIDRKDESGKNEQDRIDDAIKLFETKEPFTFLHCWKLLKDEPKWSDRMVELNTAATKPQQTADELGSNNGEPARPEGRDSAKRRKAQGAPDTSASSTAFDVLQQMNDRCEVSGQQQSAHMQKMLGMKENKIALEEKMYDLHKQDVERRATLKEEQLKLTKKDIEVRDKQSEAQLLTAEIGIMGADLEKLAPNVKAYYLAMQAEILKRRGI